MSATESQKESFLDRWILHPFVFAIFPVFSLWSHNLRQTYPEMVLIPALLMLVGAGLGFCILFALLRKPPLAGLLTSFCVLYFFLYGSFSMLIMKLNFGTFIFYRNVHRIPVYTGLFLVLAYALFKVFQRWPGLTRLLNIVSLCLFLLTLGNLGWALIFGPGKQTAVASEPLESKSPPVAAAQEPGPDIYYIILDGYGSSGTLTKYFGYDNSPFTGYLKQKGFYLPGKPRSNYSMTASSMGSSLSMEYMQGDTLERALHSSLDHKVADNNLRRFVEKNGYEYIGFTSMNPPLRSAGKKDLAWRSMLQNEFALQFLRTTVMDPVCLRYNLYAYPVRNNILSCLELLKEMPDRPGKKFVYAHVLAPHPPYVFKADGSSPAISLSSGNLSLYRTYWDDKDAYVQQVRFLNSKTIEIIEALLQKSKVPPVIVVQGDHGPKLTPPDKNTAVDIHMHILNAYYLPGTAPSALYDTITPVNTFRVIFNQYLHAGLPLLEDKCFYSVFETPFQFTDVTAQTMN